LEAKEKDKGDLAEIADLLSSVGKLLQDLASYGTAEQLYTKALNISEQLHRDNPDHPDIAQKLDGTIHFLLLWQTQSFMLHIQRNRIGLYVQDGR